MSAEPPTRRAQPIRDNFNREDFEFFPLEPRINLAHKAWDMVKSTSRQKSSLTDFSLEGNYTNILTGTYIECLYEGSGVTKKDVWFMGRIVCQTIEPIMRGKKYGLRFSYGPKYLEFLSYYKNKYPNFEFGRINVRPEPIRTNPKQNRNKFIGLEDRSMSEQEIRLLEERLRASGQLR